jgi:hypothetical protein
MIEISDQVPLKFFKKIRSLDQRVLDALMLLNSVQNPSHELVKPILDLAEYQSKNLSYRNSIIPYALQIARKMLTSLEPKAVQKLKSVMANSSDPATQLAAFCVLEKLNLTPPDAFKQLNSLVPLLNYRSCNEVNWLLREAKTNYNEFGMQLMIRNKILRQGVVVLLIGQRNLMPDRKTQLLSNCLFILNKMPSEFHAQALWRLVSFWEYYDRKTIEDDILAVLFVVLNSPKSSIRDDAARGLVNYQAPLEQAIKALSEILETNPSSATILRSLNYFQPVFG